jgi:hypothetical protein
VDFTVIQPITKRDFVEIGQLGPDISRSGEHVAGHRIIVESTSKHSGNLFLMSVAGSLLKFHTPIILKTFEVGHRSGNMDVASA